MRKLFTLLAALLLTSSVFAQSPEKMSYQAVIRDASDNLITNTQIGMQISILQGSESGTTVYVETQTPTTNTNGLLSVEIGTGTVLSGDFTAIDWANGLYFIKTEIDPSGSTSYTITGTSQLLSVPYALHAKTAESVTGGGSDSRYVGELYGGGVVFWVDHTGQHGLIVSMVDIGSELEWSNVSDIEIELTNDWDGASNTTVIIEQSGHTSSAAQLCIDYVNSDYGTGVFSDWYLPSIAELNIIWKNFHAVQKALSNQENKTAVPIGKNLYWSSTEANAERAFIFIFLDYWDPGGAPAVRRKDIEYNSKVRAIRAF